jgi:hypothetical protein
MGQLILLPCLDSEDRAAHCREVLDIPRQRAADLGRSAVVAAETWAYPGPAGRPVDWHPAVIQAVAAKRSLPPDAELPVPRTARSPQTEIQVANETTLAAARRLVAAGERVLALNFANGIHPGGGFLSGARAQEEVLCRSSALYPTLRDDPMYTAHRQRPLPDSTDWAILSPEVPVFREDDGTALPAPWQLSLLTCAAPTPPPSAVSRRATCCRNASGGCWRLPRLSTTRRSSWVRGAAAPSATIPHAPRTTSMLRWPGSSPAPSSRLCSPSLTGRPSDDT